MISVASVVPVKEISVHILIGLKLMDNNSKIKDITLLITVSSNTCNKKFNKNLKISIQKNLITDSKPNKHSSKKRNNT